MGGWGRKGKFSSKKCFVPRNVARQTRPKSDSIARERMCASMCDCDVNAVVSEVVNLSASVGASMSVSVSASE